MLFWIVFALALAMFAYVRLAPSDPQRWHRQASVAGVETTKMKNGYLWRKVLEGDGADPLQALDQVALATPRTSHLAGSVEEGQITYVTRTAVVGFPDYTTIGIYQAPDRQRFLEVYGRLRFGRSDLGVNAKRIKGWVSTLK